VDLHLPLSILRAINPKDGFSVSLKQVSSGGPWIVAPSRLVPGA
jgi:hypothetical protein